MNPKFAFFVDNLKADIMLMQSLCIEEAKTSVQKGAFSINSKNHFSFLGKSFILAAQIKPFDVKCVLTAATNLN